MRSPIHPKVSLADLPLFNALPKSTARLLATQLQMVRLMNQRPVIVACPYIFTVK